MSSIIVCDVCDARIRSGDALVYARKLTYEEKMMQPPSARRDSAEAHICGDCVRQIRELMTQKRIEKLLKEE